MDGRARRGVSFPRRVQRLHEAESALQPERSPDDVRGGEHEDEPARADRSVLDSRERVQVHVYGEGRRFGEQIVPVPRDEGAADARWGVEREWEIERLMPFIEAKIKSLGTAACPPYHLAVVIGGTSAETCLKTVKLASAKYLDNLHTSGNELGRAFRDLEMEQTILDMTRKMGIGAQFGGKYFCHDVRVIRMPR